MISEVINLYEGRDDVTLTSYVIDDSREMLNGEARPAVIVCPGGAYLGLSDREAEPVALKFNSMGYHAFVLRYSVYFRGVPGILEPGEQHDEVRPHCVYPNPMREIGNAMLMIRENAEQWKVDVSRIALCGFSAGAHNCAMYSVYWDKPIIYDYSNVEPEILRPAAAILGYVPSDYFIMHDASQSGGGGEYANELHSLANLALLGTKSPTDEDLRKVSPALHVSESTPPMFLWATAKDELVPIQNTTVMGTSLAVKNIPFEIHIFEEGKHGLSLADQTSAGADWQIDENAAKWVTLAESWLKKRFALKIP
jgi:acetyl esterase/lipase